MLIFVLWRFDLEGLGWKERKKERVRTRLKVDFQGWFQPWMARLELN